MTTATAEPLTSLYQVMPDMTPEDFGRLKESINEYYSLHGTPFWPGGEPMVDETGRVLDGHHRLKVCAELGIDAPTRQVEGWTDEEKWSYAYRVNLARRHLTREQRGALVEEYLRRHPDESNRAIGKAAGVDHKTVGSRRDRLEDAGEIPHVAERHREDADPLDHPIDVIGYDEEGTPLGWVEKETAEHLYVTQAELRFRLKVPSDVLRRRGLKEDMPRESVESEAVRNPIVMTFPPQAREQGWPGLVEVLDRLKAAALADPILRRDWSRVPKHGVRE